MNEIIKMSGYSCNLGVSKQTSNALIVASLLALSMNGVYAEDLVQEPQKNDDSNNITIADENSSNSEKIYTLTKIQTGGEKPAGDNIVTKFTYNSDTKTMTPVYYRLDLKQTTFGNMEGDTKLTFDNIDYKYSSSSYNSIYEEISKSFYMKDPDNTEYNDPYEFESGVAYSNDAENVDSLSSVLFKDNVLSVKLTGGPKNRYSYGVANGGAVKNTGKINNIEGLFINNKITSSVSRYNSDSYAYIYVKGGAIANSGTIENINADFVNNGVTFSGTSTYGNNDTTMGGAIYNSGHIGSIKGNFISNYSDADDRYSFGGAIYNDGSISSIEGAFIKNSINMGSGAAIYNKGNIGIVKGAFVENTSKGKEGGTILNANNISHIEADFIGNKGTAIHNSSIYNSGNIGDIIGDFIGNDIAILNSGSDIDSITGLFIKNSNEGSLQRGGSINNLYRSSINSINATFIDNNTYGTRNVSGGALYNDYESEILSINADFIGNYVLNTSDKLVSDAGAYGGALFNNSRIETLHGTFIGNYASSIAVNSYGGAIYNSGDIIGFDIPIDEIIKVYNFTFKNEKTGEVLNLYSSQFDFSDEALSFEEIKSLVETKGYKIYIDRYFIQDVSPAEWDEILTQLEEYISAGIIFDKNIESEFSADKFVDTTVGITNSSFLLNYAKSLNAEAKGGAIYTIKNLGLMAKDGYTSIISGNYVEDKYGKRPEAIYVDNLSELTISAKTKGKFIIDDKINGLDGYTVSLKGDETGTIYLNNNIESVDYSTGAKGSANVNLSDIMLNLGKDSVLNGNNLTLNSGTINMVNNQVGVSTLNNLTLGGDTNMVADVDLSKAEMDRFTAESYGKEESQEKPLSLVKNGTHSGNLHVVGFNMLSDAPENQDVTEIYFAQVGLKDNVVNGVNEAPTSYQTTAYTPIYKYNVMYDNREDAGYFLFTKGDKVFTPGGGTEGTGNPSDAFNPSVLAPSVAAQAGAYSTQLQTYNYAFNHSDSFMNIPYLERISMKYKNRYAISPTGNATDVGIYSPLFTKDNNAGVWVKPYTSFENIPLKNGPKVSNITYGTLIGYDSEITPIKKGFDRVITGYVGYNGASQRYSGVDSTQNGGLLGGTLTLYKGNFFNATTVSAGASVANNTNMYGKEDLTMLLAGIGNKTGYNLEFKEGRFIVQPSLLLSYTFVNTFDYTNAAGVKIDSDPLHAIQLSPGVKFIGNLPHGWQPYVGVNMVWNILGESNVRANNVQLPEMSIKPYIQYGVGVQKLCKDRFTAYGQAMITNGGRNGIALTGGFRWALGKEGKPIEKVQTKNKKMAQIVGPETTGTNGRKILKQLSQEQRTALGAKPQNTTRTTNVGVLKQL